MRTFTCTELAVLSASQQQMVRTGATEGLSFNHPWSAEALTKPQFMSKAAASVGWQPLW